MYKIENIIFDFGGVLYNIDFERSGKAFKNLGFNIPEFKDDILPVFIDLELGKISPASFVKRLLMFSENHITEKDILHAFNLILAGIDHEKVADLRKIRKKYQIFLLSNTNAIHYKILSNEIKRNKLTADFYDLFKKKYYSHELRMRKPDLHIFEFVLNDSKLDPIGTLFVDDSYENIEAAASLGIQTFRIENADSWKKLMMMLNVNF